MAHSQSQSDAGSAPDLQSGMTLEIRRYDSTDDDGRVVETETYSRREWWEDGPGPNDIWATLAKQATPNVDVSKTDDEELVLIGVMGYLDDDEWDRILDMRGFNGREWTLATVTPVDAVDGEVGHPDDPPVDEWARDPVFDATRRSLSFPRMQGTDTLRDGRRWHTDQWGHSYPVAADLIVVRAVGEPTALDREPFDKTNGYPEDDNGLPDYTAEWSYDRMAAAHRDAIVERRERQQHTFETAERMDDLLDAVKDDGIEDDQAAGVVAGAALRGLQDGRRVIRDEVDAVASSDDIDPVTNDAIWTGAEAAARQLLAAVDDDDVDALVALLTDDDDDEEEGSDEA